MASNVVVVGASEPVGALTAALVESGVEARAHRIGTMQPESSALSAALVELEELVEQEKPQALVAIGPGDATTAAALVVGKAGIPLFSVLDGRADLVDEARAVAELSSERIETPLDGPATEAAARRIAAAL